MRMQVEQDCGVLEVQAVKSTSNYRVRDRACKGRSCLTRGPEAYPGIVNGRKEYYGSWRSSLIFALRYQGA
jgi:hypothetical protein